MRLHIIFVATMLVLNMPALAASSATQTAVPTTPKTLDGVFKQGGYMWGKVPQNHEVLYEGKEINVGPDGVFFIGFNRHAGPEATLKTIAPDGQTKTHAYLIEPREYKTQHIKGVKKKHVTPDPAHLKRIRQEAAQIRNARQGINPKTMWEAFMLPVPDSPVTGVYGSRRTYNGQERSWHKGVDLAAPEGTTILAPAAGTITLALPDSYFNGNLLVVDHGHGLYSIYAHLSSMTVTEGDKISAGDKIGEVGQTGRATGPHLHWGVYWQDTALDPWLFLAQNEG